MRFRQRPKDREEIDLQLIEEEEKKKEERIEKILFDIMH